MEKELNNKIKKHFVLNPLHENLICLPLGTVKLAKQHKRSLNSSFKNILEFENITLLSRPYKQINFTNQCS